MATRQIGAARRAQMVLGLLLLAPLGACQRGGDDKPSAPEPAHLTLLQGDVLVAHEGSASEPGQEGRTLSTDDLVTTGHNGQVDVIFSGNTRVHLAPDSQLLVRDASGGTLSDTGAVPEISATVMGGQVRIEAPAGARPMAIETRQGVAKVGGTKLSVLDVTIEHGLQVVTGEIGLKAHATAPPITLMAGQRVTIEGLTTGTPNVEGLDLSLERTRTPLAVTIAEAGAQTRHRIHAKKSWQSAKRGEAVGAGDDVATQNHDATRVQLGEHMQLLLRDGAQMHLAETERQGQKEVAAYAVNGGKADVAIAPGSQEASQQVSLGDQRLSVASSVREASVALSQMGSLSQIYVRYGKATLGNTPVPPGHTLALSGGQLTGPPLPAFPEAPVALAGKQTQIFFDKRIPPVAFAWSPQADDKDVVELSGDAAFARIEAAERGLAGRFAVDRVGRGMTFWRAAGQSGAVSVTPDTGGFCATCSREVVLEDTGEHVSVSYQFIEPLLRLSWSRVGETGAYRVRVFRADDLKKPLIETRVTAERLKIPPGRLGEGEYAWDVVPLEDADKAHTRIANRWTLTHDDTVLGLRILTPKRSTTSTKDAVVVRGQLEKGMQLTLNQVPVRAGKNGFFRTKAALKLGDNTLIFHVTDGNDVDRYYTRDVRKTR